jgi:hypothetical protein
VCPPPEVEVTVIIVLPCSIVNSAAVMVTLWGCADVPVMSYVFSTPAVTSAALIINVWPWFVPITAVVPFVAQFAPAEASGWTAASGVAGPSSPPQPASAVDAGEGMEELLAGEAHEVSFRSY